MSAADRGNSVAEMVSKILDADLPTTRQRGRNSLLGLVSAGLFPIGTGLERPQHISFDERGHGINSNQTRSKCGIASICVKLLEGAHLGGMQTIVLATGGLPV